MKKLAEFSLATDGNDARDQAHAFLDKTLKLGKHPNAECREDNGQGIYSVWSDAAQSNPEIVTDSAPVIATLTAENNALKKYVAELEKRVAELEPVRKLLEQARSE